MPELHPTFPNLECVFPERWLSLSPTFHGRYAALSLCSTNRIVEKSDKFGYLREFPWENIKDLVLVKW